MKKKLITVIVTIAYWSAWMGVMAGLIWFGVYMIQGLLGALN